MGLGASGRAAVKLALARGATVVAVDSNPNTLPVEVLHYYHCFLFLSFVIYILQEALL